MIELGAFEAVDPPACPADGKTGTEEGAMVALRNRAGQLRADYVQIFRTDRDSCNRVVIRAMAFRRGAPDDAKPTPLTDRRSPIADEDADRHRRLRIRFTRSKIFVEQYRAIPGTALHLLPNAGHDAVFGAGRAGFVRAALDFLDA